MVPRYPVYIPSKGRANSYGTTAKRLLKDGVPFRLVVEPQEVDRYAAWIGPELLLPVPWNNQGLMNTRNWIKAQAMANGYARHWQLDDNLDLFRRRVRGRRIPVLAGIALWMVEEFVDRYENVAVAGLNYEMFVPNGAQLPPFYLNVHVYSCTLVNTDLPFSWRLLYNDDTDLCLQALAHGWCTVLFNAFMVYKKQTMRSPGGNTTDLYHGDGRLTMARSLERMWPGVVEVKRRFQRPQHVIKHQWKAFDTPLKLKPGVDLTKLPDVNEYGLHLRQVKPIQSSSLQQFVIQHMVSNNATL